MDYYEELGISQDATEEEIRRAHRRMTKLFHPDQHTDEGLKQLGEVQMRRLNSIVGTLLDPESRREYDQQLRGELPCYQVGRAGQYQKRPAPAHQRWGWWIGTTAAAIVLTVLAVLFWARDLGSSFSNRSPIYIPPEARDNPGSAAEASIPAQAVPTTEPDTSTKTADAPSTAPGTPAVDSVPADTPTVVQALPRLVAETVAKVPAPQDRVVVRNPDSQAEQNTAVHKVLMLPNVEVAARPPVLPHADLPEAPTVSVPNPSHPEGAALPLAGLPSTPVKPPPTEVAAATKTVSYSPVKPTPPDPLEGEWVYVPVAPEKRKTGFYPPDFIDLKLSRNANGLNGRYHARYQVSGKPISPDVDFVLTPDDEKDRFLWTAANGTRGTFKISSVEPGVIRIEWRTTVFARKPALAAGTATLVKRGP